MSRSEERRRFGQDLAVAAPGMDSPARGQRGAVGIDEAPEVDLGQMKDYRKRVEKMKQRFQREEKRRKKKQVKARATALEADVAGNTNAFELLETTKQPAGAGQDGGGQEGDCEHLFDVFRRLFEEKLELYVDRETKY